MTLRTKNMLSSGLLTGGILSINVGDPTKFDITAGTGFILDNYTDPANPVYTPVSWATQTGILDTLIATDDTTWLYINSAGTVVQSSDAPGEISRRQSIVLGWLDHPLRGPNIEFALTEPDPVTDIQAQLSDYLINAGSFNISGNDITPNGANLKFDRSEGLTFELGSNWPTDKASPSTYTSVTSAATGFKYYYRTAPGVWHIPVVSTDIDPDHYDDASGALVSVPSQKWTIQPILYYAMKDQVDVQYGQVVYQTKADAERALNAAIEVADYNSFDTPRAWLIVQEGCTDLSIITQAEFFPAGRISISELITGIGAPDSRSLLYNVLGTGVEKGGILSINADPTKFDISAGSGYIINNSDPVNPDITYVTWNGISAVATSFLTTDPRTWILLDTNGSVVQQNTPVTPTQLRTHLYIGRLTHTNLTTNTVVIAEPALFIDQSAYFHDLYLAIGAINVSGNVISPNGANLKIDRSAGSTFRLNTNVVTTLLSPNITTDAGLSPQSFKYEKRDGAGGWVSGSVITDVVTDKWDDGSGTLQTVSAGSYTVQRVYISAVAAGTPNAYLFYGQSVYATKADAEIGVADDVSVDPATAEWTLRAYLIIKSGTTDLSHADNGIVIGGKFGGTSAAGAQGPAGTSGFSGYSGVGLSGYSGASGVSGYSGKSGYSGVQGTSGYSGISGFSGYSGISGFSGISGYSGISGFSGISGYSGVSGYSGRSGYSGISGFSGYSGIGTSGYSGVSGFSGISGYSGVSGFSGSSGYSGVGTSGFSGYSGVGTSGFSGYSGVGTSGFSGYSGVGTSGFSGYSGASGISGFSGYSGISGYSGQGASGYSGSSSSGYSGLSGYSGGIGASGYSGAGTSGFSGYSGAAAGGSITTISLDFGTTPVKSKTFSFAAGSATTSSSIIMNPSPSTASASLGGDELEMDGFHCAAHCLVNGTIIAYITTFPGPVRGKRNFFYTIG